jgi:hypothetical protein
LLAFLWLNLDASREVYCRPSPDGWQGGVRHGFPATLWDAGVQYAAPQTGGFCYRAYGGWQFGGLLLDPMALGAVLAATWFVAERCQRILRGSGVGADRAVAPRAPAVRPATAVVLLAVAAAFVLLNLRVWTEFCSDAGSTPQFEQRMGWPLTFFDANGPYPKYAKDQPRPGGPAVLVSYTREELPGFSTWRFDRLGWDLLIGLGMAFGAAMLCEGLLKWRAARAMATPRETG